MALLCGTDVLKKKNIICYVQLHKNYKSTRELDYIKTKPSAMFCIQIDIIYVYYTVSDIKLIEC